MEAKAKAGEEDLSMEEILQSIRKIIAEDGEEATAASGGAAAPAEGGADASDVLELTEMVEETPAARVEPATAEPAQASAPQEDVNDILSKIDQVVVPEAAAVAPEAAPAAAVVANGQAYIDSLLSNEAASAASAAFKKAQPMDMPIRTTPSMPLRSGNTVEDLVMEALRPMLRDWLDKNLPTIVEKLVEREVRKLAH
ncbi:MAG: DUF2497 domain-containing protein [Alphaproteobacteria bacterium]|nr:DUF2497 domain-containing protein [Alphaproteobacteria bacterium]